MSMLSNDTSSIQRDTESPPPPYTLQATPPPSYVKRTAKEKLVAVGQRAKHLASRAAYKTKAAAAALKIRLKSIVGLKTVATPRDGRDEDFLVDD